MDAAGAPGALRAEELERHGLVAAEDLAGRKHEQQVVGDLPRRAGDRDLDDLLPVAGQRGVLLLDRFGC